MKFTRIRIGILVGACLLMFVAFTVVGQRVVHAGAARACQDNASGPACIERDPHDVAHVTGDSCQAGEVSGKWTDAAGLTHVVTTERLDGETITEWVQRHALELEKEKEKFPPAPAH